MSRIKNFALFVAVALFANPLYAQVEMADKFRADGKIYVVVAFILIVLSGMLAYIFLVDRKIKKLEDRFNEKHQTK